MNAIKNIAAMTKNPGHCLALFFNTDVSIPIFLLNRSNLRNLIIPKKADREIMLPAIKSMVMTC